MAETLIRKTFTLPVSRVSITYELERKQVKNLNMRVRSDGSIHISVPPRESVARVEAFLADRENWLLAAMKKVSDRAAAHPDTAALAVGDTLPYLGGSVHVIYLTEPGRRGRWNFDKQTLTLTVTLPDTASVSWRQAAVQTFEKEQTRELVTDLIGRHFPYFAARGIPYPRSIRFKSMTTRHGSCMAQNGSLNFNTRLCEYPLPFVEYVVVHELCHFLHQDHSPAFYREVAAILPDWKEREKLT